jgi:hypothetical protein
MPLIADSTLLERFQIPQKMVCKIVLLGVENQSENEERER